MNFLRLIIFWLFLVLGCTKNLAVIEVEHLRKQAFKSQEFQELKLAYHDYLSFGKTNTTMSVLRRNPGHENMPETVIQKLRDTILHYKKVRDSLSVVLKIKADEFYAVYPTKLYNFKPEEIEVALKLN